MSSANTSNVDFRQLRKNFVRAQEKDERYTRENDAKFRAVHQKVATYEEFKEIVQASHLQPLSPEDRIQSRPTQPWNTACDSAAATTTAAAASASSGDPDSADGDSCSAQPASGGTALAPSSGGGRDLHVKLPRTTLEFNKIWKKSSSSERYRLLVAGGGSGVEVLRGEVSSDILEGAILALNQCLESLDADLPAVMKVLKQLSESKRFELNLQFFSSRSKEECRELFEKIASASLESSTHEAGDEQNTCADPENSTDHCDPVGCKSSSSSHGFATGSLQLLAGQFSVRLALNSDT
ncbi:coiled-coil domain-containing protein 103-like [Sycon ciliatum]|uniref:coiled-coil domain-containing protein 103-like n=1 Tax=Sycon ciliatum TaxID=27933 RepID=UPI0020ACA99C|eukprot:scpid72621/ scgid4804/ Coiled-coil domain-containing protein 103